jgi:hypothetical protein
MAILESKNVDVSGKKNQAQQADLSVTSSREPATRSVRLLLDAFGRKAMTRSWASSSALGTIE